MIDTDIKALVAKFAIEVEAAVRRAALEAVTSALGGGSAPAKLASAPAKASKPSAKKSPAKKAAPARPAAPAPAASKAAKPAKPAKPGKRIRRSPEQLAAHAAKIHTYVKANPGSKAEKIKKALAIANNQWAKPLELLLKDGRLQARGEKRATTYTAR